MVKRNWAAILGCVVAVGMSMSLAACTDPGLTPSVSGSPVATAEPTENPTDNPTDNATDLPVAPTPTVSQPPASQNLDGVTATGDIGETPEVTIPSPWAINMTQTKVLEQGSGPVVADAGIVFANYYGVNARTGDVFDESFTMGTGVSFSLGGGVIAGFQKGLAGQKVGSRVLIAIPGSDGYDGDGGNPDAGIEIGDTLVFVVDILRTSLDAPDGTTVTVSDSSLPTLEGEEDAPTLTIPSSDEPPSELVVQQLIKGSGPEVAAEDTVIIVDYAEYVWASGDLIRQTYGFSPLAGSPSTVIPGWQEALLNQPMGSRLLVVVPPDLAYPQGFPRMNIDEGSTMVYIIDILYSAAG